MNIRVLGTILGSTILAGALMAQTELPSESERLLRQLAEFEKEERAKAASAIFAKRVLVVEALKRHLDAETKKGNLDSALYCCALRIVKKWGYIFELPCFTIGAQYDPHKCDCTRRTSPLVRSGTSTWRVRRRCP